MSIDDATTLYRPAGQAELDLIAASGFAAFPPRLSFPPIFYPVSNEEYATQIASRWNTRDKASGYVGYVTRFHVRSAHLAKYDLQTVGYSIYKEYRIPAAEIEEFNENIVGPIEVIAEYHERPAKG